MAQIATGSDVVAAGYPLPALDGGRSLTRPSAHEETRRSLLFEAANVPVTKVFTWDSAHKPWEPKLESSDVGIPVTYEVVKEDDEYGLIVKVRERSWGPNYLQAGLDCQHEAFTHD